MTNKVNIIGAPTKPIKTCPYCQGTGKMIDVTKLRMAAAQLLLDNKYLQVQRLLGFSSNGQVARLASDTHPAK
jgi:hypothetical protein